MGRTAGFGVSGKGIICSTPPRPDAPQACPGGLDTLGQPRWERSLIQLASGAGCLSGDLRLPTPTPLQAVGGTSAPPRRRAVSGLQPPVVSSSVEPLVPCSPGLETQQQRDNPGPRSGSRFIRPIPPPNLRIFGRASDPNYAHRRLPRLGIKRRPKQRRGEEVEEEPLAHGAKLTTRRQRVQIPNNESVAQFAASVTWRRARPTPGRPSTLHITRRRRRHQPPRRPSFHGLLTIDATDERERKRK